MAWFFLILWLLVLALLDLFASAFGSSRDFGAFILLHFFGPLLFGMAVVVHLVVTAIVVRPPSIARVSLVAAGFLMLAAAPALVWYGPAIRDATEFSDWLNRYDARLPELTSRASVLVLWESWGMAGMEQDGYLVSDPADQLLDPQHAAEWSKQLDLKCEILAPRRIHAGIFFVQTSNCPIDDAKVQNLH